MFTIIGADHKEYGPSSVEEIRDWITQGRADGRTLARSGSGEWKSLAEFPEFADLTAAPGTPPRVPGAQENGSAAGAVTGGMDFDVGECLGKGWSLLTANFGLIISACALIWVLDFVAQHIPLVGLFLSGPLYGGLFLLFLRTIRCEQTAVSDAFAGFGASFVQLLLAGFLTALLTGLGICLCVLPAIYLKIAWSFALALVIDKRLEFWSAMELSRKVVTRVWFKVLALTLIVFAPYLIAYCLMEAKIMELMYPQMSAFIAAGSPDVQKWVAMMTEVAGKIQLLQLGSQLVLLLNLPFAVGSLMYAYEALFGARPAKAA